jgi:hypothetical protein
MSGKGDYQVRPGDFLADEDSVLTLWHDGFADLRADWARKKLEWMYRENPAGDGILLILEFGGGEPVGVHCVGRRGFSRGGEEVTAGIMADFVVAERHRSLGPALQLLREGIAVGKSSLAFLFGFPNPSAEAVFRRAGYRQATTLIRFGRPLRSRGFLARKLSGALARALAPFADTFLFLLDFVEHLRVGGRFDWEEPKGFDRRFDALWNRGSGVPMLASVRSSEVLEWRFGPDSGLPGVRVLAAKGKGSETLEGYVVWVLDQGLARILDVFSAGDPEVLSAMLREFRWHARKQGCFSITMELAGSPETEAAVEAAGFSRREEQPVFLVDGTREILEDDAEWYLAATDRDSLGQALGSDPLP